jgi:hypothetical protein
MQLHRFIIDNGLKAALSLKHRQNGGARSSQSSGDGRCIVSELKLIIKEKK